MFRELAILPVVMLLLVGATAQSPGHGVAVVTQTENILYSFTNGSDGAQPEGGLIADRSGNLYGTTVAGGSFQSGVVFELTPNGIGGWNYSVIYTFTGEADGANPTDTLTFDGQGNLYGACSDGGQYRNGTIFELSMGSNGVWTVTTTYEFTGGVDGANPLGNVVLDSMGNIYGTASQGGANGWGTIFELSPSGNGWTEQTLHTFTGGSDGGYSVAGMIMDRAGKLYGTTEFGGVYGVGVVFKLQNSGHGWVEGILHTFNGSTNGSDGADPHGGLTFDSAGNLYGTTVYTTVLGGYGGVFKLNPPPTAPRSIEEAWQITWLYHFTGESDGASPFGGVAFDNAGNLYGTTYWGGTGAPGYGVVYKLTPSPWTESVLWSFASSPDGAGPWAAPFLDSAGHVYGTTYAGGGYGYGAIFKVTQ